MLKLILSLCLLAMSYSLNAQFAVKGTVIDDTGTPLIGVNILEKGTLNGTVTDADGAFSLRVANENATLVFSYTGYENQEVPLAGRSNLNITLSPDVEVLEEVVVTALGFKEKRDNLSSTYSKIEAEKVVRDGEYKIIDGIAGKASGVRISSASGDPGAGANIQIRGQNTITGDNQPLIIVDGVPFNNDWLRGDGSESDAGVTQQSRLNDLNPDDIESFQIYKGASAGALYGTRAMNGAIVITTKRGKKGKVNVSFSSNLSVDQISVKHPLQSAYGQGADGKYNPTNLFSWGDKIANRTGGADEVRTTGEFFASETGNIIYPIITKNSRDVFVDSNFDKVFQDGLTWDNNLTISGGNDRGTFYLSAGQTNQDGIIRESYFDKTNLTLATVQNLTDKFKADIKVNFINSESNRTQQSSNTAGLYLALLRPPPRF